MSNDEKNFQPIFQILHIKSAWFLLELAMALVTTIGMRFLQVCNPFFWAICASVAQLFQKQGWQQQIIYNLNRLARLCLTRNYQKLLPNMYSQVLEYAQD